MKSSADLPTCHFRNYVAGARTSPTESQDDVIAFLQASLQRKRKIRFFFAHDFTVHNLNSHAIQCIGGKIGCMVGFDAGKNSVRYNNQGCFPGL